MKNELMGGPDSNMVEQVLVDGDGSECGGCIVARVTPSTRVCKWKVRGVDGSGGRR